MQEAFSAEVAGCKTIFQIWYFFLIFNLKILPIWLCWVSRCHLKAFVLNFSKQVLLFEISGFKNCKIWSEVVNISVGHPVDRYILKNDYVIDWFLCLFFMTSYKKCAILMINVFEYCPRGYIEGGYYFFTRPSTAGIIRTRVLIEGWYYYEKFINLDIKTRKSWRHYQNRAFLHGFIKKKHKN